MVCSVKSPEMCLNKLQFYWLQSSLKKWVNALRIALLLFYPSTQTFSSMCNLFQIFGNIFHLFMDHSVLLLYSPPTTIVYDFRFAAEYPQWDLLLYPFQQYGLTNYCFLNYGVSWGRPQGLKPVALLKPKGFSHFYVLSPRCSHCKYRPICESPPYSMF